MEEVKTEMFRRLDRELTDLILAAYSGVIGTHEFLVKAVAIRKTAEEAGIERTPCDLRAMDVSGAASYSAVLEAKEGRELTRAELRKVIQCICDLPPINPVGVLRQLALRPRGFKLTDLYECTLSHAGKPLAYLYSFFLGLRLSVDHVEYGKVSTFLRRSLASLSVSVSSRFNMDNIAELASAAVVRLALLRSISGSEVFHTLGIVRAAAKVAGHDVVEYELEKLPSEAKKQWMLLVANAVEDINARFVNLEYAHVSRVEHYRTLAYVLCPAVVNATGSNVVGIIERLFKTRSPRYMQLAEMITLRAAAQGCISTELAYEYVSPEKYNVLRRLGYDDIRLCL